MNVSRRFSAKDWCCRMTKRSSDEMSVKQAERIIETYENASRNGQEWAHRVFLRRGTEKYQRQLDLLNEAFRTKFIDKVIKPLK